ncbi:MAG: AAA family ATPase [Candidatus Aphodosoma sp.]
MILNKIIIHNIASIEDATIDFNSEPLSDASLFLICGTMGTGKSTILDCIALSLFGTTPRLQSSPQKSSTDQEDIRLSDERQYLRRGTKEGYSILEFIGNDKVTYRAKIAFRYKKTDKIDSSKRTLEYDNTILEKKGDIDRKIKEAIDIDYSQFCRTTLLAQGEFTKFLKSDDAEKSSILEKITGTDIYSKIGRKIFEKSRDAENKYKEEEIALKNIQTLSDEEKEEYANHKAELHNTQQSIEKQLSQFRAIKQWFKNKADIEKEIENNKQILQITSSKKDETYFNKKRYVSDFERHTEQINLLKTNNDNKEILTKYYSYREKLYKDFCNIYSDLQYHENLLKEKQDKLSELTTIFEQRKGEKELYDQAPAILGSIDRITNIRNEINTKEQELTHLSQSLLDIEPTKQQIESSIKNISDELNELNIKAQEQLSKIENIDINKLSQNIESKKEEQLQLQEASSIYQENINDEATYKDNINLLEENQKQIETKNQILSSETKEIERAKNLLENISKSKRIYNDAAEQIASIRANLQTGDPCPVCGKIISSLPTEDDINRLTIKIKEDFDKAKAEVTALEQKHQTTLLELNNIQNTIKNIEDNNSKLKDKINNNSSKLKDLLSSLNIDCNDISKEIIDNKIDEARLSISNLSKEIQQYNNNNNEYKTTNKQIQIKNEELNKEKSKSDNITQSIIGINNSINTIKELINSKEQDIRSEQIQINATPLYRFYNQSDNLLDIKNKLTEKQNSFNELVSKIESYNKEIEKNNFEISEAKKNCEKIKNLIQDNTISTIGSVEQHNTQPQSTLEEICNTTSTIYDNLVRTENNISNTNSIIEKAENQLTEYIIKNDISKEYLLELGNIGKETISRYKTEIELIDNEIKRIEAIIKNREEALDQHISTQYKESINMSIDTCENKIDELEENKKKTISSISEIQTILNNNKHNIEQYALQKEKCDKAKESYELYNRLDKTFGDSEGKKLRMIAQSYILRELLNKSNDYLIKISDRYRLSCQSSSLNIEVIDNYMGGRRRPVNMMSGGESFIISLALALGLSNLNNRLQSSNILFIDEGFGTLDNNTLESVMNTLVKLHEIGGQKIGIISHVETLRERISTKIELTQKGSHSEVNIHRDI